MHPAGVDPQDLAAGLHVGERDLDHAVEAPGPEQGRVEHVDAVRRGHDPDVAARVEPVHLGQELHQRPLHLGRPGGPVVRPDRPDGVDLIDEDDRGSPLAGQREELADELRALAYELVDELRAGHPDEGRPRLVRDGLRDQGLARPRRPVEQDPLRRLDPDPLEDLGLGQRVLDGLADLDDLRHEPAHLLEGDVGRRLQLHDPDPGVIDVADDTDDREGVVDGDLRAGLDRPVQVLVHVGEVLLVVPLLPEVDLTVAEHVHHDRDEERHPLELVVLLAQVGVLLLQHVELHLQVKILGLHLLKLQAGG